nr:reverse transcriptase domain-containing protein [Tanacetum cinerariifolium]
MLSRISFHVLYGRYKLESRDIKGAPECMKICGFVHEITNPELIKRLHDKIPKSIDEMMRVTTSFLRGEVAASNQERKKSLLPWMQQEEEWMFLGYKVNTKGMKVCPDKVDVVLSLPSLKCLKDVQKLNENLASLNRFLAKLAEKSIPFIKTLKKCTKKSDFYWTKEAESAFKQMKQLIVEIPTLTAPEEKEELIVYLATAKEGVNFVIERPEEDSLDTPMEVEEEISEPWILFTDGSSYADGSGEGLIFTNPEGAKFTYALRTQREVDKRSRSIDIGGREGNTWMTSIYEYLTEGTLPAEANKARAVRRTRSVVAKALRTGYYWPTMHKDARALIRACQDCQVHRPIPRNPQQKLTPITSPWPFYKRRVDIAGPFSKGPEAIIPSKIVMPTLRTTEVDMTQNDEALEINLYLLKERREQAAIHEVKSKAKMEKYYNSRVRSTSFKPGDLMYRSNKASRAKKVGKLGPMWEGPYEVTKALGKGAYKLRDRDEKQLQPT